MYVSTFYGPLLNCISTNGKSLWTIDSTDEIYWAYDVKIRSDKIYVYFDSRGLGDDYLIFDESGKFIEASSTDIDTSEYR